MPAAASTSSLSRRDLFRGRPKPHPVPFRPPWTDDAAIRARCTGCAACVAACPEQVLRADGEGRPVVVAGGGECTFCGACAAACDAGVFDLERTPPWPVVAVLTPDCLLESAIACQLCTDACPERALRMDLSRPPVGRIALDAAACTGCGACLVTCPVEAIALADGRSAA